jgi:transcriptional regulator with XRE-family HTH domain
MAAPDPDLLARIAQTVRRLRGAEGLTLQQLADRSGVSKRTIAQVEARRTNPSIGILARLAGALRVDLPELLGERRRADVTVVSPDEAATLWQGAAGSHGRLLVSGHPPGAPELWIFSLAAGERYRGVSGPEAGEELVLVLHGELELTVAGTSHLLGEGSAAHLSGAHEHSYHAPTAATRFVKVALPPRPR